MEHVLDYTGFAIENILYPIICTIEKEKIPMEKKSKLKREAFASFLEEAKNYDECPGFREMTVEQLEEEYEKHMDIEKDEER